MNSKTKTKQEKQNDGSITNDKKKKGKITENQQTIINPKWGNYENKEQKQENAAVINITSYN